MGDGVNEVTQTTAAELNQLHGEIVGHLRTSLEKAIRLGELLKSQKSAVGHGGWGRWVNENLTFTVRTATNYMRLHSKRDQLKSETVSDLKSAYKLLAPPKSETWEQVLMEYGFNCNNCRLPQGYPPSCLSMLRQDKTIDMPALIMRLYAAATKTTVAELLKEEADDTGA